MRRWKKIRRKRRANMVRPPLIESSPPPPPPPTPSSSPPRSPSPVPASSISPYVLELAYLQQTQLFLHSRCVHLENKVYNAMTNFDQISRDDLIKLYLDVDELRLSLIDHHHEMFHFMERYHPHYNDTLYDNTSDS